MPTHRKILSMGVRVCAVIVLVGWSATVGAPQAAEKRAAAPAPVITAIAPDSAPPGGGGEIVISGKNLTPNLELSLTCGAVEGFKVQSPERAVATLYVYPAAREGPCGAALERYPMRRAASGEIEVSKEDTPEVFMIPRQSFPFTISNSGKMPTALKVWRGLVFISSETIKYVEGDKTVFSEPTPQALECEPGDYGKFTLYFRDGKSYKLGVSLDESTSEKACRTLKKRAGMPAALGGSVDALLMGEGDMDINALREKLSEMYEAGEGNKGKLRVWAGTISYVEGEKTTFSEPLSNLQAIEIPKQGDEPSEDWFQLVFKSGRKYNFMAPGGNSNSVDPLKKLIQG